MRSDEIAHAPAFGPFDYVIHECHKTSAENILGGFQTMIKELQNQNLYDPQRTVAAVLSSEPIADLNELPQLTFPLRIEDAISMLRSHELVQVRRREPR